MNNDQNIKTSILVSQLSSFIRIPSVSAETKHTNDVINCANWLANHLQQIDLEHVRIIPTKKHPIVYADWLHAPGKPTLLIYGHYDVQPVDPINEWKDDPFSGIVKNGYIYGRGSSDDKGQLFAHVKALEYFLQQHGEIPINVKCVFEGEEEIGSPGLKEIIHRTHQLLQADVCVVSDMSIPSPDQPAITYSLRGMLSLELEVRGQKQDLHSGTFGGAVYNPAQALCDIIASLHNENGKIAIPGFYNYVKEKNKGEKEYMRVNGRSDKSILKDAAADCEWGEEGYSLYQRIAARPSLSINGITSGYQGEGPKAIIPSSASAKLSFRLAQGQDPDHIEMLFRHYIHSITPACITIGIKKCASAKPVTINPGNPYIRLAAKAYEKTFKQKVKFTGSGGTIPIVNLLHENLSMPVVMMGFALPDDNPHGPNEKFLLANFQKGIATSICFMEELGRL
jgi:acetylornithine deacetylase/succinyl-diaminopimelate desuccinylase-like protein